ncbi:MAG: DUF1326 domain-containing protein [Acidimicrobiales bacterium]
MGYRLQGKMLEVCTCEVICPCWVGRDPDGGKCQGVIAYQITSGEVGGVDVSGLTLGLVAHIPGNVLQGNWRVVVLLDENATPEQEAALVEVFTGKAGGPVADLAALVGEIVDLQRVPITFDVTEGTGRFDAGSVRAEIEALTGATGQRTVLSDSAFSSIPGSPAYVARSTSYTADAPALGISLDISDRNAVQGDFLFEHAA